MKPVVLDACVLLRGPVTDFLLNLADHGLFEPIWSSELHDEWGRNLARIRNLAPEKIVYRREQMDIAFPAALCDPQADDLTAVLSACRTLAEQKDAHVVATALSAGADTIVTYNLRDFRAPWLQPLSIRAISPEAYCLELATAHPSEFLSGAWAHHRSLRSPAFSAAEYLEMLGSKRVDLQKTANWLRQNGFGVALPV